MNIWSVFEFISDVGHMLFHWRFNACLFASVALAVAEIGILGEHTLVWILAGLTVLAGFIIGWRWDNES